jgi:hypothetical protein
MSKSKVKFYIPSGTCIESNVLAFVPCFSIIFLIMLGVKTHMLVVYCGCSNIVSKFWNQELLCLFSSNKGLM